MAHHFIREINYRPTFRGKHNQSKAKCLIVLYERYLAGESGLSLLELSEYSGVGYHSLASLLNDWVKWRYLNRRGKPGNFIYSISSKGRKWLERWSDSMPIDRYIAEIEAHGAK